MNPTLSDLLPSSKDVTTLQARIGALLGREPAFVTTDAVLALEASKVKASVPKRLWLVLEAAVERAGLTFARKPRKAPMAPQVKSLTDIWGRVHRDEYDRGYTWDLHRRATGPDWDSRDWVAAHAIERLLVAWMRGIGPDADMEDPTLAGWQDDARELAWVHGLAERTMRGYLREFKERAWTPSLQNYVKHLLTYLEAAEQNRDDEAPYAFRPRAVPAIQVDDELETYFAKVNAR